MAFFKIVTIKADYLKDYKSLLNCIWIINPDELGYKSLLNCIWIINPDELVNPDELDEY